ncbi:MAG: RluA family pseudouridine synthase [Crocinitomicaceae bacterium]
MSILKEDSNIPRLIRFQSDISSIEIPEKFTFPFYYSPSEIAKVAVEELKLYIHNQEDWSHRFAKSESKEGLVIGKMFGVLVIKDSNGKLGYLVGFSGKLAEKNEHPYFVPPVFDILQKDGFFRKEEDIINQINRTIEEIESDKTYLSLLKEIESKRNQFELDVLNQKQLIKTNKKERDRYRKLNPNLNGDEVEKLAQQSLTDKITLKQMTYYWEQEIEKVKVKILPFEEKITALKEERKSRSSELQSQIFNKYTFLNSFKEEKSLLSIFKNTIFERPPAGAGECAAPKLIQYAYLNQLHPIALAEFWWGDSPKSEVRLHHQFYPACRGKCEPILGHMLEGIAVEANPMLENPAEGKELKIIYEDEDIIAVNKPAEFLSVPGKTISDSVYTRIKALYPNATGPLIVHRLDMSTSGILLLTKNTEAYKKLQYQFIKRLVQKRYVALLDGELKPNKGEINLPLCLDINDRPRQMVSYEYGKNARTRFEVIERKNNQTKVLFYPITGRTHQLRVHAAHFKGLNTPILGDDLYGTKAERLHLHAEWIKFTHPRTGKVMSLKAEVEF